MNTKAVEYEFQISSQKNFETIISSESSKQNSATASNIVPGEYFIRVRFRDKWNRVSPYSSPTKFIVIAQEVYAPPPSSQEPEQTEALKERFSLYLLPSFGTLQSKGDSIPNNSLYHVKLEQIFRQDPYLFKLALGYRPASENLGTIYYVEINALTQLSESPIMIGIQGNIVKIAYSFENNDKKVEANGYDVYAGPILSYEGKYFSSSIHYSRSSQLENSNTTIEVKKPIIIGKYFTLRGGLRYNKIEFGGADSQITTDGIGLLLQLSGDL